MAIIYIRDETLVKLDDQRTTPKGEIDRSDYLEYLLDKEEANARKR